MCAFLTVRHTPSLGSVDEDAVGAPAAPDASAARPSSGEKRLSSPAAMAITEVDDDTTDDSDDDSDDDDDSDGKHVRDLADYTSIPIQAMVTA